MNNTGLHGKFEKINENFLSETFDVFALLETIQKKYGKTDNDTIINEARDAKVAQVLGYNNINTDKHGWDAKADTEEFLEVKQASIASHSIGATFNDTTIEKTEEISNGKPRTVDIPEIGLHLDPLPTRGWSSDSKFIELHNAGRLIFRDGRPYAIHYLSEAEDSAPSILVFYSRQGNEDMKRLGLDGIFDTPKPVNMLKYLLRITGVSEGVVLDFFAGSGSFCQAVEEVNKEDGKNLQCLLIQLDEDIELKTEAFERCLELGIEPNIPAVLEARLKKIGCDYEILR